MAKKNSKTKAKQDKTSKLVFSEILSYAVWAYLFMMLTVFPLYVRDRFVYVAAYKVVYYRNISLLFLGIGLILLAVFFVQKRKELNKASFTEFRKKITLLDVAVLSCGLWNVLSFLTSSMKADAIRGFGGWEMGLVTQGLMVFGYIFIRLGWDRGENSWYLPAAALTIESILVVLNRTGNDPLGFYKGLDWFSWSRRNLLGTIGNINWLCGYLICVLPVLIYFYITGKKFRIRLLWGIALYLSMAAIMLQGSRSGVLALVVGLIALMFFLSDTLERFTRYLEILFMVCIFWTQMTAIRVDLIEPMHLDTPNTVYSPLWYIPTGILAVLIICFNLLSNKKSKSIKDYRELVLPLGVRIGLKILPVLILLGAVSVFLLCQVSDSFWNLLGARDILKFSDTWGSSRGALWKESLKEFSGGSLREKIFGIGPDCYGPWFMEKDIFIPQSGYFEDATFSNAHNEWVTTLVQTGIGGVIVYLGIFVTAAISFAKKLKMESCKYFALLGVMLLILFFSNQFFSFQHICATPIFYILLAMCESRIHKEQ